MTRARAGSPSSALEWLSDHDTGLLGLGLGNGYLLCSSTGSTAVLDASSQKPAMWSGRLLLVRARLASGSRELTLRLNVNGATRDTASATVGTSWVTLEFGPAATFTEGDLLALRYEGLVAAADQLAVRAVWQGTTP